MTRLIASSVRPLLHSTVCRAELQAGAAKLPLEASDVLRARTLTRQILREMPPGRMATPSGEAWEAAGVTAGILARTQGLAPGAHKSVLLDALVLLGAAERDAVVVTANVSDFDLLLRLHPYARVLLYRKVPASPARRA